MTRGGRRTAKVLGSWGRWQQAETLTEIRLPLFSNKGLSHDRGYWATLASAKEVNGVKIKRRWGCREVSCLILVIVFLVFCGLVGWQQYQDKRAFRAGSARTATPEVALASTPKPLLTGTSTPIATPTRALTPTPQPHAVVTAEALNLRAGPGVSYDKVGLLHQGEELTVRPVPRPGIGWQWPFLMAPKDGSLLPT